MRNEWLEDFRLELYSLGKAIWDYQEGIQGAMLEVYHELRRVAKQIVREFVSDSLLPETKEMLVKGCVLHMTKCEGYTKADGTTDFYPGTSLLDKLDLSKQDCLGYCILHMTEYLRNNY